MGFDSAPLRAFSRSHRALVGVAERGPGLPVGGRAPECAVSGTAVARAAHSSPRGSLSFSLVLTKHEAI